MVLGQSGERLRDLLEAQIGGLPPSEYNQAEANTDVRKELVHVSDALKWLLELEPNPSTALLFAVLFHDLERIVYPGSTGGFKGDKKSQEYRIHKERHAARSAILASLLLEASLISPNIADRVAFLVSHHDDEGQQIKELNDQDLELLVSADSLSFFSIIAKDMFSRNVAEDQIKEKMAFSVRKMNDAAKRLLEDYEMDEPQLNMWKNEALGLPS